MADKPIGQLPAAPSNLQLYSGAELLVLEQDGTAKKLSMQILENWLLSFAAGHGGIQTISKTGTVGLVDTYTITFSDQSTATFDVTNGNGITGVTQYWAVSASNTTVPSSWSTTRQTMTPTNKYLWSYMTFTRDSGTFSTTKAVVGVYGDTGQAWYVWIKYAGVQPTSDADMGDTPDNWMGVYSGTQATAPTSYTAYQWFEIKGATGNTGATGASIASVTRTGGTGEPGSTDTYTITLDNGLVAGTFTVYNGLNGSGAVATVNGIQPDAGGNVALTAANINTSGGTTVQAALADISENKQNRIAANGILKGNGTTVSAATIGTDYTAIDDTLASSATKTYSINKIKTLTPTGLVSYAVAQTLTTAQQQQARDNIKASKDWTLLWENANPASSFAAQTISLNLSGYEWLLIEFNLRGDSSSPIRATSTVRLDFSRALFFCFWAGKYIQRPTPENGVLTSGITFSDAQSYNSYGGSGATDNNYLIPSRIFVK